MPYTNDMATLAQLVSPVDAAVQAGTEQYTQNQQDLAKAAVAQATVPAEIQKPFLGNLYTAAQTAGQQGIAQQEQAKGAVANALVPSQIGAGQAENQTKITTQQAEQLGTLSNTLGGIADKLDTVAPPARQAYVGQLLDNFGVKDPSIRQLMLNSSPDDIRTMSNGLLQASNQYRTQMAVEKERVGGQLGAAEITGTSHVAGQQVIANARQYAADVAARTKEQLAPLTAIAGQLAQKAAAGQATPEEQAMLQWIQQSQQLIHSGSPFQAALTGTQVPSNIPGLPQMGAPTVPSPPAGGATATQAAPVEDAWTAEMRKRGLLK